MHDPDAKEYRLMNINEARLHIGEPLEDNETITPERKKGIAEDFNIQHAVKKQAEAIVELAYNMKLLLKKTAAEDDTKELCRELCLTAEFFNKILQSEKFNNIPF